MGIKTRPIKFCILLVTLFHSFFVISTEKISWRELEWGFGCLYSTFSVSSYQELIRHGHWPTTEEFAARYQSWVESSKAEHVLLIKCLWVLCLQRETLQKPQRNGLSRGLGTQQTAHSGIKWLAQLLWFSRRRNTYVFWTTYLTVILPSSQITQHPNQLTILFDCFWYW